MDRIWSYSTTKKSSLKWSLYSSVNGLTTTYQDLLNSNGQFMSHMEFKNKFAWKTNFLQFYQVVGAIPKHLATKAKNTEPQESEPYVENNPIFQLDVLTGITYGKAKTRDLYCLFNKKIHTRCQTGPAKWNEIVQLNGETWKKIYIYLAEKHL